jgi:hypothetical protein
MLHGGVIMKKFILSLACVVSIAGVTGNVCAMNGGKSSEDTGFLEEATNFLRNINFLTNNLTKSSDGKVVFKAKQGLAAIYVKPFLAKINGLFENASNLTDTVSKAVCGEGVKKRKRRNSLKGLWNSWFGEEKKEERKKTGIFKYFSKENRVKRREEQLRKQEVRSDVKVGLNDYGLHRLPLRYKKHLEKEWLNFGGPDTMLFGAYLNRLSRQAEEQQISLLQYVLTKMKP